MQCGARHSADFVNDQPAARLAGEPTVGETAMAAPAHFTCARRRAQQFGYKTENMAWASHGHRVLRDSVYCIEGASNLRKSPALGGTALALFLAQPSFGLNEQPFRLFVNDSRRDGVPIESISACRPKLKPRYARWMVHSKKVQCLPFRIRPLLGGCANGKSSQLMDEAPMQFATVWSSKPRCRPRYRRRCHSLP